MLCPGATRPPINKSFDPIRSSDDPVKTQGCEAWQNDMWQLAEIFDEPLTAGRRAVESVAVRVVAGKSPASTGSRGRPGGKQLARSARAVRTTGAPAGRRGAKTVQNPDPFLRPRPPILGTMR